MNIHELAKKHEAYCIEMRRYFHMHPELGLHEENTSKVICEELEKMGITDGDTVRMYGNEFDYYK